MRLGALEASGRRMLCAIGNERGRVIEKQEFPTGLPEQNIADIVGFFQGKRIDALGIGSFGPLNLDPKSKDYGSLTTTPKPGWENFPLRRTLWEALDVPVGIDTDVDAAALAEVELGAGKNVDTLVYYNISNGIGGGVMVTGRLHHGLVHPEMGHMLLRPDPRDPEPKGFCPYHDGCLEGLAGKTAIEKRWGIPLEDLPADHVGWDIEADYLAQMCVNTIVMLSPERIVLGGPVMRQLSLFDRIRKLTTEKLNGYVAHKDVTGGMKGYIVPPALGENAVLTGALLLAFDALKNQ